MAARATQDSLDLGWSDQPLADTVQSSEQPAVPLDNSDDDEPTRVAASAVAVVAPAARADIDIASAVPTDSAVLDVPAVDIEALDASDIHDEGARVTEPGLAPPPLTSAELAAAEPAPVQSRVDTPRTAPPITNPPPVELGSAAVAAEPVGAAPAEARPPATVPEPAAAMPAVSIAPPPIAPVFFTPPSLAPTAVDWDEFASPSLLATMKRTRPTSAWTGVGLFVAALTFAGGLGIGRSMSPPTLPPVAVPAPLPATAAAGSLSVNSAPATTQLPSAPVAPSKPPAPFDAKAARAALDDAADNAKTCRITGDPKGTIPTTVTFAPSGNVSNVAINSSRYAGTKTASCVAERLREARVPEFSGFPEALKRPVTVR